MSNRKAEIATIRRLKGAWKSDAKKTGSRWIFPKRIARQKFKVWQTMFGHNEWRFTPTRVYGRFEDRRSIAKYKVLWADEWSAVPLFETKEKQYVHHLHFDGDWFFLLAGRDIVEYFKRVGWAQSTAQCGQVLVIAGAPIDRISPGAPFYQGRAAADPVLEHRETLIQRFA
jgi:hypothetical protein